MKRVLIEIGASLILAPMLVWFITFITSTYELKATVADQKADIQEIKADVKYIKNYLLERK